MFYEKENSLITDDFKYYMVNKFGFPPHLHRNFELITPLDHVKKVSIDAQEYTLYPGEAVLIFPNQIHSLFPSEKDSQFLCLFSPNMVQAYSNIYQTKIPENNLFQIDLSYVQRLQQANDEKNMLMIKGLLYQLCGEFHRNAVYQNRKNDKDALIEQIFEFVENNYISECSLDDLAKQVGYHYVYLSKYFKRYTGMSFTEYVNRHRINEACYLLKNTDESILKIAYDCGFHSLRSFNRNFKSAIQITPQTYRENGYELTLLDNHGETHSSHPMD